MRLVVIGCGNSDRGDDAAGLLVARRLIALGFPAIENRGDLLGLLDTWEGAEQAIIVDTVVTGAEPGSILCLDATAAPLARFDFRCSTHSFGVAEAIELGRSLGRLPPRIEIYGIEGASFGHGAQPSPEVLAAVEVVAERILCMKLP